MHSGPEYDIEPLTAPWRDMDSGALAIAIQPLSRIFNDDVEPGNLCDPALSSGVEKGLHHLPREPPGFPIRNPFYTGQPYTPVLLDVNRFGIDFPLGQPSVSSLIPWCAAD